MLGKRWESLGGKKRPTKKAMSSKIISCHLETGRSMVPAPLKEKDPDRPGL